MLSVISTFGNIILNHLQLTKKLFIKKLKKTFYKLKKLKTINTHLTHSIRTKHKISIDIKVLKTLKKRSSITMNVPYYKYCKGFYKETRLPVTRWVKLSLINFEFLVPKQVNEIFIRLTLF